MASANGCIAWPRNGTIASGPASPTPIKRAPSTIPPFAYQSTLILGTDGGLKENLPEILNRGSFGSLGLGILSFSPSKKSLILSIMSFILSLAVSIGFKIRSFAWLNLSRTSLTKDWNLPTTVLTMPVTRSITQVLMLSHMLESVSPNQSAFDLIQSQALPSASLTVSQTAINLGLIESQFFQTEIPIAINPAMAVIAKPTGFNARNRKATPTPLITGVKLVSQLNTFVTTGIRFPIAPTSVPRTTKTGPIAANKPPSITTVF